MLIHGWQGCGPQAAGGVTESASETGVTGRRLGIRQEVRGRVRKSGTHGVSWRMGAVKGVLLGGVSQTQQSLTDITYIHSPEKED